MRTPKPSPLYAFIQSWKELRGITSTFLVKIWARDSRALLFSPEHHPRYALVVKEEGAYTCHEHEASLAMQPQLQALFFTVVQEHQLQGAPLVNYGPSH